MKKLIKIFAALLIVIMIHSIYTNVNAPRVSGIQNQLIDVTEEPVQESAEGIEKFYLNRDGVNVLITPLAKYSISAKVKSKKNYSSGWGSKLSPVDFALAWGKLNDKSIDKYITYTQSNRWYYYRYTAGSPVDETYISAHSANNHIIPSNDNVWRAVKTVKKGDTVKLQGYLVKIEYNSKGEILAWNSSTTREDTGDGACEVFYVNEIRIGNKIYK